MLKYMTPDLSWRTPHVHQADLLSATRMKCTYHQLVVSAGSHRPRDCSPETVGTVPSCGRLARERVDNDGGDLLSSERPDVLAGFKFFF